MGKVFTLLTQEQAFTKILDLNAVFVAPTTDQKKHFVDPIVRELKKIQKNGFEDYRLNVIEAFTGSGKTTVLTKHTLNEVQKYANGVLILAPSVQLAGAMFKDGAIDRKKFHPILLNSSTLLDMYIEQDAYKKMPVFIATTQFFIHENNLSKFHQLLQSLSEINPDKIGMTVFVDEAHKGAGTSSDLIYGPNFGVPIRPNGYDAVTFNALLSFIQTGDAAIFCFTATPTVEQQGKIPDVAEFVNYPEYFNLLTRYDRDPTKSPFVETHHVHVDLKYHKIKGRAQAKFYVENILAPILLEFLERCNLRGEMQIRQAGMMIRVSRKPNNSDFIPIKEIEKQINAYISKTSKKYNWHNMAIARYTQQETIIDGQRVEKDLYVDLINDIKDRPVIQLVVDGLINGTDFPFVSDIVTLGIPFQVDPEKIGNDKWNVANIEQFAGRAMRTGLAPYDVIITEIVKMGLSEEQEKLMLDKIIELVTTNIYFNDADMHYQLAEKIQSETYTPEKGRAFLDDLLYGEKQVSDVDVSSSKLIRTRQKEVFDQTDALKKFKKSYCENSDGKANIGYNCTATIVSPAQLQVDHIDGNRYNNNPNNYMTLCANCHAEKGRLFGDCYNNYTGS